MVNKAPLTYAVNDMDIGPKVGNHFKKNRRCVEIRWPESLFQAILSEATSRGWSFSHMVRHLCEASIDGIE